MRTDVNEQTCVICHEPINDTTCSRACEVNLAFARGTITDYPEETHMSDDHKYQTLDGQAVDLYDFVYIKHGGYCRAEITDTRKDDDTGPMLLVECGDGPNWVYEDEIWAEAPEETG